MNRSTRSSCLALAVACAFAAGCATDNPNPETTAPSTTVSSTPGVSTKSTTQQAPAQRMSSAAKVTPKGAPSQLSVYYDLDRYDIKPQFVPAIEAHARYLRENAGARITIEGNGDERGSREYNLALGQRRAEGVRQMLRLSGAAEHQVEAVSLGEEKPRSLGHDEASWSQNRRSDLVYQRTE